MFEALRLASYLSRVAIRDLDQWLSAEEVLTAASEGSASILGFDRIGKLEKDYKADIVFTDLGDIDYRAASERRICNWHMRRMERL